MLNKWEIIKEAIFTERTTSLAEEKNIFTFKVHPDANKIQIKEAIEEAFKVKVLDIRTIVSKPKVKVDRYKGIQGRTNRIKKAMVKLAEGQKIEFA